MLLKSWNWLTGRETKFNLVSYGINIYFFLLLGVIFFVLFNRYFSYLSKAGDKMRFDLALAASEARSV